MAKKKMLDPDLTAAEIKALASAVSDDVARDASSALSDGKHTVDFTVHLTATIDRNPDYEQRIVEKAQPWDLLAVALSKLNGVTVESLVREATDTNKKDAQEVKDRAEEAMEKIKGVTKTRCNGPVRVDRLDVEVVRGV